MFVRACSSYLDVIHGLRERADQLQISRQSIDDLSGLSDGYAAKLLAIPPVKVIGFMSMEPLFSTLGVRLMLVEDTAATARTVERRAPVKTNHQRFGNKNIATARAAAQTDKTEEAKVTSVAFALPPPAQPVVSLARRAVQGRVPKILTSCQP